MPEMSFGQQPQAQAAPKYHLRRRMVTMRHEAASAAMFSLLQRFRRDRTARRTGLRRPTWIDCYRPPSSIFSFEGQAAQI